MRIISGKHKGRKLSSPEHSNIRPTSDRMKEAVFSMINSKKYSSNLIGKNFLDLFSGSGSIGIEAFSRGAGFVYMIENNNNSIKLIKKNMSKLGLNEEEKQSLILIKDNVFFLKNCSNLPVFDFIYIDPPYQIKNHEDILTSIYKKKILNKNTLIFIETGEEKKHFHELFSNKVNKKFSNCYLNILQLKNYVR